MPKPYPELSATLGERFTELRATLSIIGETNWSRASVAKAAQISVNAVARLERTSSGTAANLTALSRFYQNQGFNLQWLYALDNKYMSPYNFEGRWEDSDRIQTFEELAALRNSVQESSIQERITMILVKLLPTPSFSHRTKVDLRRYQYYLPPVVATSSGWRTRAFHIPPHHYYVAGESVPQCGAPFEYLVFDSSPEKPSNNTTCLQCAELISLA